MTRLDYALYQVGVQQRLVVLYMPDYVTQQTRLSQSSAAWLGMGRMLPEYDITLPLCPGPFTDDQGHAAFFDKNRSKTPKGAILDLKRDFLTSMASAARSIAAHRPQVLVADGQGALVALGMSRPLVLEAALALRNVDIKEALQIAKAWGNVRAIILKDPRVSKARLRLTELKQAIPEPVSYTHLTLPTR